MSDARGFEGLLAAAIFVAVVAAVLVYTQVIVPRRQGRGVRQALRAQGWVPADPLLDEAIGRVEGLAIAGALGPDWEATYDERLGPVASRVRVRKETRGSFGQLFRDASSRCPRFAGIASVRQATRSKSNLDLATRQRMTVARTFWIGEARRLPVARVETVVSALAELLGSAGRELALGRGVAPASRPEIAQPPVHALAERLRQVMHAHGAGAFAASLYLSPEAWALVAPVARVGSKEAAVLETASAISAALDEG